MASPRTTPTKFEQRREATRAELLRLGVERFPLRGYSATTIEDIVRDSGLTRGAFYFHFSDKEEFFLELLQARARMRGSWWEVADDPANGTLEAIVLAALERLASAARGGGTDWIVLVADFAQSVRADERYARVLAELHAQWIEELTRFVDAVGARGLLRRDRSPAELAATVFATAEGHDMHLNLYGVPPAGLVDALVRILRP